MKIDKIKSKVKGNIKRDLSIAILQKDSHRAQNIVNSNKPSTCKRKSDNQNSFCFKTDQNSVKNVGDITLISDHNKKPNSNMIRATVDNHDINLIDSHKIYENSKPTN